MTKKWNDYIMLDEERVPVSRKVPIKQYGIAKVVVVRTESNGGIRRVSIPVRSN